ncbi:hypothetical protein TNCV_5065821 [Trichonephila clavipes]|nr:hypothetical protein TNCV_5065821 [Trichonephila clavipes]
MVQRNSVGNGRSLPTSSDVTNQWLSLVSRRCWLGTHVYKMTPTAFDYHSISYGAHAQCAPFDTVRITSIRRTNRRFSVKLANYREEGVIYRSEKLASSHFTYITHYGQRKSEKQEIAIKQ